MFDVGFSEILVIGVVALVVIGPERLPTVARTLGKLVGRAQRYVNDVKSEVEREMRLDELKKMQAEVQAQASSLEQSVMQELQHAQQAAQSTVQDVNAAVNAPVAEVQQTVTESLTEVMQATGHLPPSEPIAAGQIVEPEAAAPVAPQAAPLTAAGYYDPFADPANALPPAANPDTVVSPASVETPVKPA